MKIHIVTTVSIGWLNDNVVHHKATLDVWNLVFFCFWKRCLSEMICSVFILIKNLNFVHLEFCRGYLERVRLGFPSCCLVFNSNVGLALRRLLSIKLISQLRTSLVNHWTYQLFILLIVRLVNKRLSVCDLIEVSIVSLWLKTQYLRIQLLRLIKISLSQHLIDSILLFARIVFLSIYWIKLRLTEGCIIRIFHWIV
jgi:hypothetical protein